VHRVYMRFERVFDEWRVSFTNLSSKDALREFTFVDSAKVEAMAARAGALRDLAAKQGLENGFRYGLGGMELRLTAEQYAKLRR
jgi:hypothetical protein